MWHRGECGFDFAIRTPCTPARWEDFDAEMTSAWEVSIFFFLKYNKYNHNVHKYRH